MNYPWSKTVFPIAIIFAFRMWGLFLLIPVFSVYALSLEDATPILIGFALGIYGLSQGIMQIPFGLLSDKLGRKPVLVAGLLLFAGGSLLGAFTHSIYGMIIARTLQGTGAIGSVLIALLADLTPDEERTKAMAVIGITIGLSFSSAMIFSPFLAQHYGLKGIFLLTSLLALTALVLLYSVIPTPKTQPVHCESEAQPALLSSVLKNKQLLRLDLGIFCQHYILTATFFVTPFILKSQILMGALQGQWQFYLPLMLFAFLFMVLMIIIAEKRGHMKKVFLGSVLTTILAQWALISLHLHWWFFCTIFLAYFTSFNILEATLPSMISKQAPSQSKGTAMGVYSTSQFLGLFAGGALAGVIYNSYNIPGVFLFNGIVGFIWLIIALPMRLEKK